MCSCDFQFVGLKGKHLSCHRHLVLHLHVTQYIFCCLIFFFFFCFWLVFLVFLGGPGKAFHTHSFMYSY